MSSRDLARVVLSATKGACIWSIVNNISALISYCERRKTRSFEVLHLKFLWAVVWKPLSHDLGAEAAGIALMSQNPSDRSEIGKCSLLL